MGSKENHDEKLIRCRQAHDISKEMRERGYLALARRFEDIMQSYFYQY